MNFRLTKKGISISSFKLTAVEIEEQVLSDLFRYQKEYFARHGSSAKSPLDVENFIKELWGIEVSYDDLPQSKEEDNLGYFEPEKQLIVIDPRTCNNPGRISFTVAHEAGHLSLHAFLFSFYMGRVSGWKNNSHSSDKNLDKQADLYAASLLAPKQDIYSFLGEKGLSNNNVLLSPIDLSVYALAFQERFGLSRQALEIRLHRLGVPMVNKKYSD